ncbi:hypothetical protein GCM10011369_27420 [Neiella marina]|uniref:Lipoprotein n=1 Tax=Neiella marina TaxID=508461 RepID=A0A8J2U7K8_9GAMM|nr:hypothetical protein [Neiella marina]GGA83928.1 hypothetical protein GCM10011369_27420 [Neiella marina]
MKSSIVIYFSVFALLGCGGGGGGSSSPAASTSTSTGATSNEQPSSTKTEIASSTQPETNSETEQPTEVASDQLQIDANFDFDHQQQLAVTIETSMVSGSRYFATICARDLTAADDQIAADYSQCLWQATLVNESTLTTVVLPAHIQQLVTELWQIHQGQYQVQRQPLQFYDGAATVMF